MINSIQQLLAPPAIEESEYPQNSRYHGVATRTTLGADGTLHVHLKRRFVPAPENLSVMQVHKETQGDRLDQLAHQYLGDPELFWRICDGNLAMRPDDLTKDIGRSLSITLPEGIPGGTSA